MLPRLRRASCSATGAREILPERDRAVHPAGPAAGPHAAGSAGQTTERMFYHSAMKTRTVVELPGYVTVAVAADRLRLAPRSVRDLVYTGRMPSARLGRRHLLRIPDVEAERRRRLGLPLPPPRPAARRRRGTRRRPDAPPAPGWAGGPVPALPRAVDRVRSEARR